MDEKAAAYYDAAARLPAFAAVPLRAVLPLMAQDVTEIRLRSGRAVLLTTPQGPCKVRTADGTPLVCTHAQLQTCFHSLCGYSVHSMQGYVSSGFVPVPGGHRAGVCGTAYLDESGEMRLKNMTSIDLRIARPMALEDTPLVQALVDSEDGVLFAGVPGSGKTTVLRGFARLLSQRQKNVALVDERFELAPVDADGFLFSVPEQCDVLSGYPKHLGVLHALRSLSPDVILCDEVGTMADAKAIEQAANAGVRMVATIHGADAQTLLRRPQTCALLETGAFGKIAFLEGPAKPARIKEVAELGSVTQRHGVRFAGGCGDDAWLPQRRGTGAPCGDAG